jgi:hypothetical protein
MLMAMQGDVTGIGVRCFLAHFDPERRVGVPPPRVFLRKSSESLEKKRVEFLMSAKEFGRV